MSPSAEPVARTLSAATGSAQPLGGGRRDVARGRRGLARLGCAGLAVLLLCACSPGTAPSSGAGNSGADSRPGSQSPAGSQSLPASSAATSTPSGQPSSASASGTPTPDAPGRPPAWLGTRPLPLRPDGYGEVLPTPPELVDRQFTLPGPLPDPPGAAFSSTISPVPADVLNRSTWHPGCPVAASALRYVTVSFWGFDHAAHTGELLVNAAAAANLVTVFHRLFDARFPIEQMRISSAAELHAAPTGDGNDTQAFVCRNAVGSTDASQHAFGLAIDVNPFQNPYHKGAQVLPELASNYLDRDRGDPGMITPDGVVRQAFGSIGWGWGGSWRTLHDYMHFSRNGT